MDKRTYYTAVGRFTKRHDADGNTYPVIYVNQQEHLLDLQEMAVWTALTWRLSDFRQLERKYDLLARELHLLEPRTLENCLRHLEVRGLVVLTSCLCGGALAGLLCLRFGRKKPSSVRRSRM